MPSARTGGRGPRSKLPGQLVQASPHPRGLRQSKHPWSSGSPTRNCGEVVRRHRSTAEEPIPGSLGGVPCRARAQNRQDSFGANLWRVGLIPDLGEQPRRNGWNATGMPSGYQPTQPARCQHRRTINRGGPRGRLLAWSLTEVPGGAGSPTRQPHALGPRDCQQRDRPFLRPMADGRRPARTSLPSRWPPSLSQTASRQRQQARARRRRPAHPARPEPRAPHPWSLSGRQLHRKSPALEVALEVLPPDDLRSDESDPSPPWPSLATTTAPDASQSTRTLSLWRRFVVTSKHWASTARRSHCARGASRKSTAKSSRSSSGAETEHASAAEAAAPSVPEAVLRAALDGLDDLTEDLVLGPRGSSVRRPTRQSSRRPNPGQRTHHPTTAPEPADPSVPQHFVAEGDLRAAPRTTRRPVP